MSIVIASYHDPYGYRATICMKKNGRHELIISTSGKTVFKGDYVSRASARSAMNRFCDIWTLEK